MKRALSIAALLLALALLLTGCHGTRSLSAFTLPDAFDETKQYEVVFWAKNDTNKTQTAIYQGAIEDFEKLYPNIAVTMRLYTNYSDIYNDVITNLATGTTPDVCVTYPDHIATYLTGENTVVPLDTFWDDARYGLGGSEVRFDAPAKDEIIPEYLEEGKIGDHVYALPFMRSTEACYINRTYVEALGYDVPDVLTWDFIWTVSEAAAQKDEDGTFKLNGQKVMIPFIYKSTDNMMIQYLRRARSSCLTTRRAPSSMRSRPTPGPARSRRSRFPAIRPTSSTPASACSPSIRPPARRGWGRTRRSPTSARTRSSISRWPCVPCRRSIRII